VGSLPVAASGWPDLGAQIWSRLGSLLLLLALLWSEQKMMEKAAAPLNNSVLVCCGLSSVGSTCRLPLAGRGGEERMQAAGLPPGVRLWRGDREIRSLQAAPLPPAGRGGEERERICFCGGGSGGRWFGRTDAASRGVISTASPSITLAGGQPPLFFGSFPPTAPRRQDLVQPPDQTAVGQPLPPCSPRCRHRCYFL
jgi:hypothetical protein